LYCEYIGHVTKKGKYDKADELYHWKQPSKKKKKKKCKKITLSENVHSEGISEHVSSLDIPRLPHSPAEVSANWKQLIQVKSHFVYWNGVTPNFGAKCSWGRFELATFDNSL